MANGWNMGFCQLLIIKDGAVRPIGAKMKNNRTIYRALCEKDGKLCLIESKKVVTYEFFVKCLSAYKVTHALYLDMVTNREARCKVPRQTSEASRARIYGLTKIR